MELGLKGRRALVTGSSSGLGAATAMALALEGAEVIINSRNHERLQAAAKKIGEASGREPICLVADVSNPDERKALLENASEGGPIDILVSNAGGPPPGLFLDHSREKWDEAANLVLQSAISLTRGLLHGMIERKWGRLIYITSVGALQPVKELILSNTYRAAVTGFCKTISNTYAEYGITANCVCPGYTRTERLTSLAQKQSERTGQTPDEVLTEFARLAPANRVGEPEELAGLVAFLAGDTGSFITGASIPVDGGRNMSLI